MDFDDDEIKFLKETVGRDLQAVNYKCEEVSNDLAKLGRQLSQLKETQTMLRSIQQTMQECDE